MTDDSLVFRPGPGPFTANAPTLPPGAPGGGGSGTKQVFIDRDPAAPDDPTSAAISYASDGSSSTNWSVANQAWF